MNLPQNTSLPFFAYGLFKRDQLCFPRIQKYVKDYINTTVKGRLKERDGIPLYVKEGDFDIQGTLFHFETKEEENAYNRIIDIEPRHIYVWDRIRTNDNIEVNILLGKRHTRGSEELENIFSWDGRKDPLFTDAIEEVKTVLSKNENRSHKDYKQIFRLQMSYVLLWTSIERYLSFRYGLNEKVHWKILELAKDPTFINSLKLHVLHKREIYSTTDLDKYTLDPDNAKKSIEYYYQVRSNSVHRGKAVDRDFSTIKESLKELLSIFQDVLESSFAYSP